MGDQVTQVSKFCFYIKSRKASSKKIAEFAENNSFTTFKRFNFCVFNV